MIPGKQKVNLKRTKINKFSEDCALWYIPKQLAVDNPCVGVHRVGSLHKEDQINYINTT